MQSMQSSITNENLPETLQLDTWNAFPFEQEYPPKTNIDIFNGLAQVIIQPASPEVIQDLGVNEEYYPPFCIWSYPYCTVP